jgi:hypothetical protein
MTYALLTFLGSDMVIFPFVIKAISLLMKYEYFNLICLFHLQIKNCLKKMSLFFYRSDLSLIMNTTLLNYGDLLDVFLRRKIG